MVFDGSRLWLEHFVRGKPDQVAPDPARCVVAGHTPPKYVGFAHTHLPDSIAGQAVFGFSHWDFAATLTDGDNLAIVCNGPQIFALVRTADATTESRPVSDRDPEFLRWTELYAELNRNARAAMKTALVTQSAVSDRLNASLWQANQQLCEELGFAFYRGEWGQPLELLFGPEPGNSRS